MRAAPGHRRRIESLPSREDGNRTAEENPIHISVYAACLRTTPRINGIELLPQLLPTVMQYAIDSGRKSQESPTLWYTHDDYDKLCSDIFDHEIAHTTPDAKMGRRAANTLPTELLIPDDLRPPLVEVTKRGFLRGRHDLVLPFSEPLTTVYTTDGITTEHDDTAITPFMEIPTSREQKRGGVLVSKLVSLRR